jgi:hypothetical protein
MPIYAKRRTGGVKAILSAVKAHVGDHAVQRYRYEALIKLFDHSDENRGRAVDLGCVEAVVGALRAHKANALVQQWAVRRVRPWHTSASLIEIGLVLEQLAEWR